MSKVKLGVTVALLALMGCSLFFLHAHQNKKKEGAQLSIDLSALGQPGRNAVFSEVDEVALLPQAVTKALGNLADPRDRLDRKSTRLNSSHANISYAVFC